MASAVLPLALLVAYAFAFGTAGFGLAVPGYDDHPGQLYRLMHALRAGPAPWAWNDGWWAGYPELQFYPPGFFYLGLAAHRLALGWLDAGAIYVGLLWLAWLAPGVAAFALLARTLGRGWAALPGAFVALTLSAGTASGVEGGVHVGMLPARLALAALPVLALALLRWVEGAARGPWLAVPLVAAIALTHPTHLPAGAALVALAAAARPGPAWRRAATGLAVLVVALAGAGFWLFPLLARVEHTRALAWGRLDLAAIALDPLRLALLGLALASAFRPRALAEALLARWAWLMAAVVAADAAIAEPLGLRWLPADRVADGAWLAVVVAAGLVLGRAVSAAGRLETAAAVGAVVAIAALSLPARTLTLWPGTLLWPPVESVERGLRMQDLWRALGQAPPGRVLFTRSGAPLVYGTEWWRPHSHVTALTPAASGRAIVHGTFTHPSPVAALVYRGDAGRGAIDALAERLDGHRLFGRPLEALDGPALERLADRLGISAVVALDEDVPRLSALERGGAFARSAAIGPFVVYTRAAPVALPEPDGAGGRALDVDGAAGGWTSARLTYYPLWRAERGGRPLETRPGPAWDLEVRLDAGTGPVRLTYGPGLAEWAGLAVSAAAAITWLVLTARARHRRPAARDAAGAP